MPFSRQSRAPKKRGECPAGPGTLCDLPRGGGDHGADTGRARRIKIKFIAVLSYKIEKKKKITPNKQPETHQLQKQSPNPVLWEQAGEDTPFSAKREVAVRAGGWLCRGGSPQGPGAHCTVFFGGHGGLEGAGGIGRRGQEPLEEVEVWGGEARGLWHRVGRQRNGAGLAPKLPGCLPGCFARRLSAGAGVGKQGDALPRASPGPGGSREGAAGRGLHVAASPAGALRVSYLAGARWELTAGTTWPLQGAPDGLQVCEETPAAKRQGKSFLGSPAGARVPRGTGSGGTSGEVSSPPRQSGAWLFP